MKETTDNIKEAYKKEKALAHAKATEGKAYLQNL
jgi:hypothetical protein